MAAGQNVLACLFQADMGGEEGWCLICFAGGNFPLGGKTGPAALCQVPEALVGDSCHN